MSATEIEELLALLAVVALLAWGARAVGLPYPVVLLLGGVGLGFVPGVPELEVDPDVVFLVFLPPLVHAAAYTASSRRLRAEAVPIGLLALGLVAATTAVVAVVAHALVDELSWAGAIALGAIVAPTDPVAASAVFRRLGVPERVSGIVEGESLVNDGSALVFYRVAVAAAVSGSFSLLEGAGELVLVASGGVAVGVAVALLVAQLRRRLDDALIEVTITLLTPYAAYVAAEELHVSGVLAAVASGIVVGRRASELFSPGTRLQAGGFWSVLVFILESVLFILIGLQFPAVADRVGLDLVGVAAVVCVAVIATRVLFTLALPRLDLGERLLVGWSGMRGAVSLAAALAIPLTTDAGEPFPGRDEILFVTLVVIGVTLVLHGLTLPALIRAVVKEQPEPDARRRALARFAAVEVALEHLVELGESDEFSPGAIERARELYTQRASQLAGECRTGVAEEDGDTAAWLRLRLELLAAERGSLHEQRDRGEAPNLVVLDVERDLDLEASRLQGRLEAQAAA